MRKEAGILSLLTCAAGAFGMFLRWLHLGSSFEAETGLSIPGSASSLALGAFCAAAAAALLVFTRSIRDAEMGVAPEASLRGRSIFCPLAAGVLALLTFAGALLFFIEAGSSAYPALMRILAIFAALCALSFPVIAIGRRRDPGGGFSCLMSLVPVLFFCFWLIISYKENSANPVVWAYAIEILAISSAVLGFYYSAGFAFGRSRPLQTVFFCQLGAFFCIVTLADSRHYSLQMILLASAAMLLLISGVLMGKMTRKKPAHPADTLLS